MSEDSASIIGYAPAKLFQLSSFLDIFTREQADNLLDHLDFIREESGTDLAINGPEVFMLSLLAPVLNLLRGLSLNFPNLSEAHLLSTYRIYLSSLPRMIRSTARS